MKLCNIERNGVLQLGVYHNDKIVDLSRAVKQHANANIPTSISECIGDSGKYLPHIKEYIHSLGDSGPYYLNEEDCLFGPVLSNPEKIICVGLNYRRHADETGAAYPEVPILFNKFNNSLTGHGHDIAIPPMTEELDYEVELAIVIGKTATRVSEDEALDYVLGYTTANDLSARDLQMKTSQWLLGKTCDDFCPIGPYLVTADEINDPQNLSLQTEVNGETRQESNTSDMIFSCKQIISYISHHFTLKPGDVILTGTPEGVVLGLPKDARVYLKSGDSVSVSIEKIGTCTNKII
ncbi:fumarylacetoacetate hydrolase family protein [Alkalicoccobacillus murimartini]|uniref:2-keto-4-pentenoate hydratase/2-oxohepta-3-ene-1,7-dioic acid hydratase in catechol pathway n=1 Tax=Alkalicoccobacillus murimartini TaxID=171685 RepID=A0ABT9YHH4_9BACI|nr:fumarylacetoacetate hydrolase family protein [Alkalicoccobacillus murimartini]MDQ0207318.1 2-keto-4-pentenoate hydratase/2-oxohepta-3-ene-1,7-dioic acid hydratase in catechol pathway [Alkalicoccobacillus murimartini]